MVFKVNKNLLWLLAHPDDEILGLHLFSNSANNFIVYLTDGVRTGANYVSAKRIKEAKEAWSGIDQNAELIFFGTQFGLKDGELQKQINDSHLRDLVAICRKQKINKIITLQLEGGHQDHDITSLLAEELSNRLNVELVAFPAYRAIHQRFPIYAVMSSSSRLVEKNVTSIGSRIRYAKQSITLIKTYRTQVTTWVGLGPFVILKYLFGSLTFLPQSMPEQTRQEFPKRLLYANRKKSNAIDYANFQKEISGW
ncbi:N-acetylglucosaminyl phosphatidylinositol deacetylase-related [Candidatus Nanopelagicaceae bacterium]